MGAKPSALASAASSFTSLVGQHTVTITATISQVSVNTATLVPTGLSTHLTSLSSISILSVPTLSPAATLSSSLPPTTQPKSIVVSTTQPLISSISTIPTAASRPAASGLSYSSITENASVSAAEVTPSPTGPTSLSTANIIIMATAGAIPAMGIITLQKSGKGPFLPENSILGGVPTVGIDVPITAVFFAMFIAGAATHFTIHELNGKRGHKFHLSDAVFDFCMVRNITCIMRIVWATHPTNPSIALAALIFENAGAVVLFAINIFFTQRIIRAIHPKFGWHPAVNNAFWGVIISVPLIIFWNITVSSVGAFVTSPKAVRTVRGLSLFGSAWTTLLSLFPIIFVPIAAVIPSPTRIEKFGLGRFRWKVVMVIWASAMLFVGAVVRAIANAQVHPRNAPGQVDSRAVFYTTGFMLEILVVFVFAVGRIDLLFHVPDGCTGPGDYITKKEDDEEEFFQDVDVKMRMSMDSATAQGIADVRWQDAAPDRTSATREQVKQAIDQLRLKAELVSNPIGAGNEELLVYAFRVKKDFQDQITRPPRTASWEQRERDGRELRISRLTAI